ncbi:hypothetical protein [Desertivirga arenae]|uniref:hypothetical protein n=1 Tax=Desertivirga arenae TaxID=2810309 RepID=UPI001A96B329|nr:hypothetical protein [Pedobacter sp. SYSU D00823]
MQKKIHITHVQRLVSAMLLLLFLCVHLLEVFHAHHQYALAGNGDKTKQHFEVSIQKCKICDFLTRTRKEPFCVSNSIVLSAPLPKAIELSGPVVAGIYKFTLQGFSNKGPPSLS